MVFAYEFDSSILNILFFYFAGDAVYKLFRFTDNNFFNERFYHTLLQD